MTWSCGRVIYIQTQMGWIASSDLCSYFLFVDVYTERFACFFQALFELIKLLTEVAKGLGLNICVMIARHHSASD